MTPNTTAPNIGPTAHTVFMASIKKKYASMYVNSVLNLSYSLRVCQTWAYASLTVGTSLSFSIGGSGTYLNVKSAKPNHHTPDEARQNLITASPPIPNTNPKWTTNSRPPPRYPYAYALLEILSISSSLPRCGNSAL